MKKFFLIIILILSTIIISNKVDDIFEKVKDNQTNFKTAKMSYNLQVIDKSSSKERELSVYILINDDKSKSIMRIEKPLNVAMTTVLNLSEDETYVYLPSLKRVKKITGSSKNGNFLDTDFKYSDLSILTGEIEGKAESYIKDEDENYYYINVIIDDEDIEYTSADIVVLKNPTLIKTATFYKNNIKIKEINSENYKTKDNNYYWESISIEDFEKDHKTLMNLVEIDINIKITDRFFNKINISMPILKYR